MGLNENAVDLFEIDDAGLVADGLNERAQAKIAGAAQHTFAGADNEGKGLGRKAVVTQAATIQLIEDKLFDDLRAQAGHQSGVSDAGTNFLVDGQAQGLQQGRLAQESQAMRTWKVLAKQAQFPQAIGGHEMGVVNNWDQHLASAMHAESLLDQQTFAMVVAALELDLEGFAEDAQGVVISVESTVDHGCDQAFGIVRQERMFEDALAGAGFAQNDTEAPLLGVDSEDVKDFLLVVQKRDGFGIERVALQAKMRADHGNSKFKV
jgi:hypothetical protein